MTDIKVKQIIENEFAKKTILVIGDLMVDQYVTGKVSRISPEAPVPVLNYSKKKLEAGGASNVACNLRQMGCNVLIAGVAANDEAGLWLRKHLASKKINIDCIIAEEGRSTSIKTRFATKGQQLLRLDNENTTPVSSDTSNKIYDYVKQHACEIDGVILSDYKKGIFSSDVFLKSLIELCHKNDIIVAIDSKSRNISAFQNADFVKPNNLELENAVDIKIVDEKSLDKAGKLYLEKSGVQTLLVTRGPMGISVFQQGKKRKDYAAAEVQVYDVTGAGDTVISMVMLSTLSGLDIDTSVIIANIAAGIVINKVGTASVSVDELLEEVCREKNCM